MVRLIILATLVGCAVALFVHLRRHGAQAFRGGWIYTLLLVPTWFHTAPGGLYIDARSAAAVIILLTLAIENRADGLRIRLVLADGLVLLALLGQLISHLSSGPFGLTIPYNLVREWCLPYAVGRVFLRFWWDEDRALPAACTASAVLSAVALVEAVSHVHLVNVALGGGIETEWFADQSTRWGLRRPVGPMTHSIYLGLSLAMLLPWVLEASRRSRAGFGPRWWRWAPWIALAGVVCSTSRAAQLVAGCALLGDLFFRKPDWRPALLLTLAACVLAFFALREEVVDILSQYAGESKAESWIMIEGERYEYSGTHHRDLLGMAYREASAKAGFLGFAKPTLIPRPADLDSRLKSVDDHYLLWRLLFGDLGLFLFCALMVCVCYYLIAAALPAAGPFTTLAGGLAGAMLGMAIALRSVWFSPDFGAVWLWTAGVAAAIRECRLHTPPPG